MRRVWSRLRVAAEAFAAAIMAAMFLTFVLQILIRYSAPLQWLQEMVPFLEPTRYGWTLEFCLLLWVWLIFWGNAFVVRDEDHVTFDIVYNRVRPGVRRWFAVVTGVAIALGLLLSIGPTWEKFHILRLKKTATLSSLFGDWIRMRDIYWIYILFLVVVAVRYGGSVYRALRHGAPQSQEHAAGRLDE